MESSPARPIRGSSSGRKLLEYLDFRYHAIKMKGKNVYRRLDTKTKEFRLLELYPGRGSDRIRCFLRTASLVSSRCPPYETISYAWGDPTDRAEIEINGASYPVPRSSMLAIARMRYPSRSRTLWIDAVCIDQNDLNERAEQVVLMRDVYSKSSRNLVYLGEEDESTASAIKSIMAILGEILREVPSLSDFQALVVPPGAVSEQRSATGYEADLDFEALDTFYSRAYFRRLWVTQETLLAPSNICHCGPHEFNLLDIFRASVWLRYKDHFVPADGYLKDFRIYEWWRVLERKPTPTTTKFFRNVRDLCYFAAGRETSDERDRVFALIGLLDGDVPLSIRPNYHAEARVILREAMRHCLICNGYLDCAILRDTNHKNASDLESHSQPSWVKKLDETDIWPSSLRKLSTLGRQASPYKLSTEEEIAFWSPKDRDELVLKGFIIDKVDRHSSVLSRRANTDAEVLLRWINEVESLTGISLDGAFNGEQSALLEVLIAGDSDKVDPATEVDILEGRHLLPFLRSRGIPDTSRVQWSKREEVAAYRYWRNMWNHCTERVVLFTSSGRMGLGPSMTRPGDLVAVLCGCSWPVILRPAEDDMYNFVGVCYVHVGEAVEIHEAAGGTDTMIRIR